MSHQIYFVHSELDVHAFLNLVYGKGGVILCENGLLRDKEQAFDVVTQAMLCCQKLSIVDARAIDDPNAAVISLTLPAIYSWEPRVYQAGRLYFPPDSAGVYDPACLKLFRRIKNGITKNYHYVPSAGHYLSDRLLQGCREGKWSAVYYHGVPIPLPDQVEDGSESKGKKDEEKLLPAFTYCNRSPACLLFWNAKSTGYEIDREKKRNNNGGAHE